jgi:hypothetical protein
MKHPLLPEPLDRDVREALEFERGDLSGPDDAKARVLERVAGTVGLLSTSAGGGGRSEPASGTRVATHPRAGARWWRSPLWHLVTFALGTMAGALAWRATQAPLPSRVVYVDRSPPAASAPAPTVETIAAPLQSAPAPASPQAPASAPASPGESLASERALLDVARSAFGRGESDEALAALARHEKLFPGGQLAEEREALAVRSLVLAGRASEARARAARFRKRYPTSVMLPAVEASLDGTP